MKRFIVAIAIGASMCGGPANALSGNKDWLCPAIGSLARSAMTNRQNNVDMSSIIKAIQAKLGADDPIAQYGVKLVIMAYQRPMYLTDAVKHQVIEDFANQNMAVCYDN